MRAGGDFVAFVCVLLISSGSEQVFASQRFCHAFWVLSVVLNKHSVIRGEPPHPSIVKHLCGGRATGHCDQRWQDAHEVQGVLCEGAVAFT